MEKVAADLIDGTQSLRRSRTPKAAHVNIQINVHFRPGGHLLLVEILAGCRESDSEGELGNTQRTKQIADYRTQLLESLVAVPGGRPSSLRRPKESKRSQISCGNSSTVEESLGHSPFNIEFHKSWVFVLDFS